MIQVLLTKPLDRNQRKIKEIVNKTLPFLRSFFAIPKNVKIYINTIPDKDVEGNPMRTLGASYRSGPFNNYVCEINDSVYSSVNPAQIVETLAHEFTHIQQMYQGRLSVNSGTYYWMEHGSLRTFGKTDDFDAYVNFPREVEARDKARKFLNAYSAEILDIPVKTATKSWIRNIINYLFGVRNNVRV